ncbi:MAG: hypothetical protein HY914_01025 [Desulfomonile tiedjei]|nr:hypothetical protein [Desulfomonile tiedjei]
MDYMLFVKAGFTGFALGIGVLILVFYLVGAFVRVTRKNFVRVFVAAALLSFLAVDLFLYHKIRSMGGTEAQLFLAGCIGGWLGGILAGLTNMKGLLLGLRK